MHFRKYLLKIVYEILSSLKNYDIIFMIISYSTIISVNLIYLHCKKKSSKFNYCSITALLMHKPWLRIITDQKAYRVGRPVILLPSAGEDPQEIKLTTFYIL